MNDKHVIVRLKCTKCPHDFFTMGVYNKHLFMDHKIRSFRLHPPVTVTNEGKLVTTSEPSVMSPDITSDKDDNTNTPSMLDESNSDRSLPDISPPPKPVKVTGVVPENERDLEKYYCEYCTDSFFTKDSVKQYMENVHFGHLDKIFGDNPDYVEHKKTTPKPSGDYSRERKRCKQETDMKERNDSVKERNDSVGRRKRVKSDVIETRRTRSKSILILQDMKCKEEELKNVQERESSLEMSKEEFVKSYNLRRKDNILIKRQEKGKGKSQRNVKSDDEKEDTAGKSENTDVEKEHGTKDTEPKADSRRIVSKNKNRKGDKMGDDNEPPAQNDSNDDYNDEEGQSQDMDTAQDSAYWTENDTDTHNE